MLDELQVANSKQALEEIRNGERPGNTAFVSAIELLLYILGKIRINPEGTYCDWLQWNSVERRNEIEEKLEEMYDCIRRHRNPLVRARWGGKEILDHHFWNDCDAFWCAKGKGRYGDTPGEDVLIKLYCESETPTSWICPYCGRENDFCFAFCPEDGAQRPKHL